MSALDTQVLETDAEQPRLVEVRRNARLAAAVGSAAVLVAAAFFVRGGGVSYVLGTALLVLAALQAWTAYDGRTPLLLIDAHGVRIRCGHAWRGLPWSEVEEIEHLPRRSWWKDGRLAVLPRDEGDQVTSLGRSAWHARVTERLYGVPFAVPLGLGTRVVGTGGLGLTDAIAGLAGEGTGVVEIDEGLAEYADEDVAAAEADRDASAAPVDGYVPAAAAASASDEVGEAVADAQDELPTQPVREDTNPRIGRRLFGRRGAVVADASEAHTEADTDELARVEDDSDREDTDEIEVAAREDAVHAEVDEPVAPSPTPSALREPTVAIRTDLRWTRETDQERDASRDDAPVVGANALRLDPAEWDGEGERTDLHVAGPVALPDGVSPIAKPGEPVEPLVIDDPDLTGVIDPAPEPVIGPELAAARTRLGLTVDTLAERTRIRPHVIESIEVDDFGPCGGDFYARGHLRTLARVLAVDVAPLLETYDERYASAPVNPTAVFRAELAGGSSGTLHKMRGGPNWSVLVAAVMAVVLVWSVARLLTDSATPPPDAAISLGSGSADNQPYARVADPVPVELTAAGGGAHVVVRDARGQVVFTGDLAFGETKSFKVSPPVRVQTSDGSLQVSVDGGRSEPLGKTGESAQRTFTAG